ncbi:DUF1269 domain-containing protein [Rhodocyclus gracilis]|uniref:DUF1269 domain-containing protein n=1 Tax=Rhodocyclus gracilis TaxID=2929842 RepID=UPI001E47362C|nr:DUF1269 domain-containing protein [Rhodocyclus gracilis]
MSQESLPFYSFNTHREADDAIKALGDAGFDMKKLSLVGKGCHSEEQPVGFYSAGDRIKAWGGVGAFWGGIWGLLLAPAVFFLPGVGVVAMAGPLATALIGALEGAVVVGGLSALGAALSQIGMTTEHALKYETVLKADKYLLTVHGSAADHAQVKEVLAQADPHSHAHVLSPAPTPSGFGAQAVA